MPRLDASSTMMQLFVPGTRQRCLPFEGEALVDAYVGTRSTVKPAFRPAAREDLPILLAFMRAFYAIDAYHFDEQAARSALETLIGDQSLGRVWLIMIGGESVGYVVLTFGYSLEYQGRDAFIDELFIESAHRGKGVGGETVAFVLEACRGLSVQALHLEVERGNAAGQALYRRAGFENNDRILLTRRMHS